MVRWPCFLCRFVLCWQWFPLVTIAAHVPRAVQRSFAAQAPHVPPQPSSPHPLPMQFGAQSAACTTWPGSAVASMAPPRRRRSARRLGAKAARLRRSNACGASRTRWRAGSPPHLITWPVSSPGPDSTIPTNPQPKPAARPTTRPSIPALLAIVSSARSIPLTSSRSDVHVSWRGSTQRLEPRREIVSVGASSGLGAQHWQRFRHTMARSRAPGGRLRADTSSTTGGRGPRAATAPAWPPPRPARRGRRGRPRRGRPSSPAAAAAHRRHPARRSR